MDQRVGMGDVRIGGLRFGNRVQLRKWVVGGRKFLTYVIPLQVHSLQLTQVDICFVKNNIN